MTKSTRAKRTEVSKAIGRYLDELDRGAQRGSVSLGPKGSTTDPVVVEAFADKLQAEVAETTSPIRRLKLTQRVLDLRAAAEELRNRDTGESALDLFVEHAAAWAEEHGITYAAFRELGVPAAVLKQAGVT